MGAMKIAPALCSSDTRILLNERYETTYGIANHDVDNPNRPLLLIALHRSENTSVGCTLYRRLEQFADLSVAKHFGLSIKDFLDFPSDVVNDILEISAKRARIETTTAGNMLDKLEGK
jgi:hypothetical protein